METSKTIKEVELALFSQSLDGMVRNREESKIDPDFQLGQLNGDIISEGIENQRKIKLRSRSDSGNHHEQFGYVGFEESV